MVTMSRVPAAECQVVAARCACFALRKAARAVTQAFDEALRPTGLQPTQFSLLVAVRLLGEVGVSDLADEVVADPTTLSRNLAVLQRRRFIGVAIGADRRTRLVRLTDEGHAVLARALPAWQEMNRRLSRDMGAERLAEMVRQADMLTRIASGDRAG
jgi:DNA-binding MarR family transcriptional regulator